MTYDVKPLKIRDGLFGPEEADREREAWMEKVVALRRPLNAKLARQYAAEKRKRGIRRWLIGSAAWAAISVVGRTASMATAYAVTALYTNESSFVVASAAAAIAYGISFGLFIFLWPMRSESEAA